MSKLKELGLYRTTFLSRLLENDNLVKLIYYNTPDVLSKPTLGDERYDLVYNKIFPYQFVPEVDTEASTFLTMKFGKFRGLSGNGFKSGYITIFVFCHKELIVTDDGLRYDLLANEIEEVLNSTRGEWMGQLKFDEMDEILINKNYYGIYLSYEVVNFNAR